MTSPLDKVCIKIECTWKSNCAMYFKAADNLHRQYINPEHGADGCHYFEPIKQPQDIPWGVGKDDDND